MFKENVTNEKNRNFTTFGEDAMHSWIQILRYWVLNRHKMCNVCILCICTYRDRRKAWIYIWRLESFQLVIHSFIHSFIHVDLGAPIRRKIYEIGYLAGERGWGEARWLKMGNFESVYQRIDVFIKFYLRTWFYSFLHLLENINSRLTYV